MRKNILSYSLANLAKEFEVKGIEKYRAKQVWHWVYWRGHRNFEEMADISKKTRAKLADEYFIDYGDVNSDSTSIDQTRKWLVNVPLEVAEPVAPGVGTLTPANPTSPARSVTLPQPHHSASCKGDQKTPFPSSPSSSSSSSLSPSPSPSSSTTSTSSKSQARGEVECVYIPMSLFTRPPGSKNAPPTRLGLEEDEEYGEVRVGGMGGGEGERASGHTRGTVCLSSQMGCSLQCSFCRTGAMSKANLRNLTQAQILGQLMIAKQHYKDFGNTERIINNIVMMGMGEPLLNYRNVMGAIEAMMEPTGMGYGKRAITVSTSGIVPNIIRMAQASVAVAPQLAVSLHAVNDELRDVLVPINKTYPIAPLLQACKTWSEARNRRVTFEYVLLKGVNDSLHDAAELSRILRGVPALVNLIPFNPWPGSPYKCPTKSWVYQFADVVCKDTPCTIRWSRGSDISAACGQLATDREHDAPRVARLSG